MATKKKSKAKAKSKPKKKKSVAKRPAKKVVKKKAARKVVKKGKVAKKRPAKKAVRKTPSKKKASKPAAKPAPKTAPVAVALPGETRIGIVTHYFSHLSVAVIRIEAGMLREGDTIHIKGHTSDFRQRVASMEVDHVHVPEARPGQSVGLKVSDHAREHDVVYRVGP
jgi:outer membrane biosynthesis protein TonB